MGKIKITIAIVITAIIAAMVVAGVYFYRQYSKMVVKTTKTEDKFVLPSPNATGTPKRKDINILLMGYGGGGHDGGTLTDTIMVVNVNPETKKAVFISVPRDLWVDGNKINYAYTISADNAKSRVSKITGLTIDYFVVVDFSGFTKIIDLLGGISVFVPQTFDDFFYPIAGRENESCGKSNEELAAINATMSGFLLEKQYTCRYEHLHFDKGMVAMNGETALKYVRSRHSDTYGSDFARSERQKTVLDGVKNKVISLNLITKADPIISKVTDSVRTDITLQDLSNLLALFGDPKDYQTDALYLTKDNVLTESVGPQKQYILLPKTGDGNWGEVRENCKR